MKNIVKKLICLFLALCTITTAVIASESGLKENSKNYECAVGLFKAINFLPEEILRIENQQKTLSRIKAAEYLGLIMGENGKLTDKNYFSDIEPDLYESTYVNNLVEKGVIKKSDDGKFRPDDNITQREFSVMLLRMLGYESLAEMRGGYPIGYIQTAREIKFDMSDKTDDLTCGKTVELIYDAVLCSVYEIDNVVTEKDNSYAQMDSSKGTFLELYRGIKLIEGVVTDNGITGVISESQIASDEVKIDDIVFDTDVDCAELIGETVRAFYKYDKKTDDRIVYIWCDTIKSERMVIEASDYIGYVNGVVSYYDYKGNIKKIQLAAKHYSFKNGEAVTVKLSSNLSLVSGTVTLIKSVKGDKYNVIRVDAYENMVIRSVDYYNKRIYTSYDKKDIYIDYKAPEYVKFISMPDNKTVTEDFLDVNDVISVYRSLNGNYLKILISTETKQGVLSRIKKVNDRKCAVINGEEYFLGTEYEENNNPDIGNEYLFRINAFGEIAASDIPSEREEKAAFLCRVSYKNMDNRLQFRLFTEDSETIILNSAHSINVDGVGLKKEAAYNFFAPNNEVKEQLILYKTNKDGEVYYIDTCESEESGGLFLRGNQSKGNVNYNDNYVFYPNYAVHDATVYFFIPNDLENDSEFMAYKGKPKTRGDVSFYALDNRKPFSDYVVSRFSALTSEDIFDKNNYYPTMVDEIAEEYVDGEIVKVLRGIRNGSRVNLFIGENVDLSGVEQGDLIRYSTDVKGRIAALVGKNIAKGKDDVNIIDFDYNNGSLPDWENNENAAYDATTSRLTFGYVSDKFTANSFTEAGEIGYKSFIMVGYKDKSRIDEMVCFSRDTRVTIFDPNRRNDKVYSGSFDEIMSHKDVGDNCDIIVVAYNYKLVKDIFIYKKYNE